MRSPLKLLLAFLVLFVAIATPATAATPKGFFGVMADGPLLAPETDLAAEARLMRTSGVGTVRIAFYWRDMQPSQGQPVDFAGSDRVVKAVSDAGLDVLPILVRAPAWAANGDTREGAVPNAAAYGQFVRAFVQRYGKGGSFGGRDMRQFQVWNEPDIDRYLSPPSGTSWAKAYVPLLRAARTAIKAEDRNAKVVAAGLTNKSWVDLGKLYDAGARRLFDAAAIHPFSARVENVVKIVKLARNEMNRNGDSRKPLLLTEISWSSGKGQSSFNYGWETTERGQATKVRQALTALVAQRRKLRIGGLWWYTWLSPAIGDDESFSYGGLRRQGESGPVSKPALAAFKQTVSRLRKR